VADDKPIEVRYTRLAPSDAIAYAAAWQLKQSGDLIDESVVSAGFHINSGRKQYLTLTLGNGLVWNDTDKLLTIYIENGKLSFIREDGELHYEAFVVLENNTIKTVREGPLYAVRVG